MSAAPETAAVAAATPVADPVVPQSALPTDPSTAATTEAPAAAGEAAPAEATPVEAAAANGTTTEKTVDENKAEVTAVPVSTGVLGYKAPGVLTQFRFKKQYFWLGDEAVTSKDLHQYLRGTKPEISHPVAAWASQTGKGLLFSSKDEKKGAIADVVPLADATYITKEGAQDFAFRQGPKKHQHKFQASSQDERNGWVVAVTAAHEEAKKNKDTIESSDGYKASLKELKEPSKPSTGTVVAGSAAAGGAATAAVASKDAKDSKETPKETEAAKEPEAAKPKERSQSSKRASIFGGFGKKKEELEAKKEEKKEELEAKKEEKKEELETKKEEKKAEKEEKKAEKEEQTKNVEEGTAVAAPAAAVAATEERKPATGSTERSKSKRRSGIFGIFDKAKAEVKKDETKIVDAFKDDPTAAPGHTSTLKKEEKEVVEAFKEDPVSPEAAKKENTAPTAAAAASADKSATSPGEKRRSSFFGLGQKFGSVRNKQPKATETKAEEAKPETVAESKTEPVAAPAVAEVKPVEAETKAEPTKAIGDVVPEAVSVGQEQAPNGTAAVPAVASTA